MITDAGTAVPQDMADALVADPEALSAFKGMRPADQRNFVDWLGKPGRASRQERLAELATHVRAHHS